MGRKMVEKMVVWWADLTDYKVVVVKVALMEI